MNSTPYHTHLVSILILLASCVFSISITYAKDVETAIDALEAGDEEKAFSQLQELAKTGDKRAQYGLGLMYANGMGTARDLTLAYAWLNVAAQTQHDQVLGARDTVASALTEEQRPEAQAQAKSIIATYGSATINRQNELRCERYSTTGSNMIKKRCYRGVRERQDQLESGSFDSVGQMLGLSRGAPGIAGSH